jgi:hypothetical protein
MTTDPVDRLIDRYVTVWNEPDPARRLALLETCFVPDGVLLDPYAPTDLVGPAQIEPYIGQIHSSFVAGGGAVRLTSKVESYRDSVRFSWVMTDPEGKDIAGGVDTIRLAPDGRIQVLITFLGIEPAPL